MNCTGTPAWRDDGTIEWCGRLWAETGAAMSLGSDEPLKPGSSAFFINLGVSVGLVVTAGLMAGLTMVSRGLAQ